MNTQKKVPKKISVVGLGKLGACYSAFFADAGFRVIGADVNKRNVAAINAATPPSPEPKLREYLSRVAQRLSATTDTAQAVVETDVTFIIVPTPSLKDGSFSLAYIVSACEAIGAGIKAKDGYHLVSVVSTVLPGDSRTVIIPALEKASGKKCGVGFGYTYNPSLIAIGDIFHNLEKPDFLFLGAFDTRSQNALEDVFRIRYPKTKPEYMSIESVEVAKIALNSYITTKITFANMLGQLCEQVPFANVESVTTALGKDTRVGSRYLKSGLGFGGPCFPRDNNAFAQAASRYGVELPIARAVHNANLNLPSLFITRIKKVLTENKMRSVGFLGVSYKPRTTMVEESQALAIAKGLTKKYAVSVFEPLGNREAKAVLKDSVTFVKTLPALVKTCDVIFISNNDPLFSVLPKFANAQKKPVVIIDPWNMFESHEFKPHVHYKVIGNAS
jgi:UDPglucose 6-dehydrogenase